MSADKKAAARAAKELVEKEKAARMAEYQKKREARLKEKEKEEAERLAAKAKRDEKINLDGHRGRSLSPMPKKRTERSRSRNTSPSAADQKAIEEARKAKEEQTERLKAKKEAVAAKRAAEQSAKEEAARKAAEAEQKAKNDELARQAAEADKIVNQAAAALERAKKKDAERAEAEAKEFAAKKAAKEVKAAEAAKKRAAEEKAAQELAKKKAAEAEKLAKKKAAEDKKAAEEAAKKKAEEELAKKKADEKLAKKRAAEAEALAKKKAEEAKEQAKKKAAEEKKAAQLAEKKAAKEEQQAKKDAADARMKKWQEQEKKRKAEASKKGGPVVERVPKLSALLAMGGPEAEAYKKSVAAAKLATWKSKLGDQWEIVEQTFDGRSMSEMTKDKKVSGITVEKAVDVFKNNPEKYLAMHYFPANPDEFTFIVRDGTVGYEPLGLRTDGGGRLVIWRHIFKRLIPFKDDVLPAQYRDKYTDAMKFSGKKLHSDKGKNRPILPGRGMGMGDEANMEMIGELAQPAHVRQGACIGDCWLLSAIACLADFDWAVKRLFRKTLKPGVEERPKDQPNQYTVTLWDLKTWKEVDVVVDERLPVRSDGTGYLLGAKPSKDGKYWVPYLEKAIAMHCGGYDKICGKELNHLPRRLGCFYLRGCHFLCFPTLTTATTRR